MENVSCTLTRYFTTWWVTFFLSGSSNHYYPDFYNDALCFYFSTVLIFGDLQTGNPSLIGSIDPNCDVAAVVQGNL